MKTKIDYGVDAPGVIRTFFAIGFACAAAGMFFHKSVWGGILLYTGIWNVATSTFMLFYAKRGKFRHRDRMLGMVDWHGNETVLDVGTGRGLLMIGAAKKLTSGKSVGIDIWNAEDLSSNHPENTLKNIRAEGVADRVELKSEDVRQMSFPDASFDVVLSNLCIHNLYQPEQRSQACREIARVLKPGGVALISDFRHTAKYVDELNAAGLTATRTAPYWKDTYPPLRVVVAHRPE